jgi:hypothetical protein
MAGIVASMFAIALPPPQQRASHPPQPDRRPPPRHPIATLAHGQQRAQSKLGRWVDAFMARVDGAKLGLMTS